MGPCLNNIGGLHAEKATVKFHFDSYNEAHMLMGDLLRRSGHFCRKLRIEWGADTEVIELERWWEFIGVGRFTHCSRDRKLLVASI